MPYCSHDDAEFYAQVSSTDIGTLGYDFNASIHKAINDAAHMIDDYCNVPEDFFIGGGIEIDREYLNGVDVAYIGGITKFFPYYYGGASHLRFTYKPVLSVTKLEEEVQAGSWALRTEGAANDYIVVEDGVRFVQNVPAYKYKNVRVTYRAGYHTTPWNVSRVAARLAAEILQDIIDRRER